MLNTTLVTDPIALLGIGATMLLAFGSGANDISKSVATLVGSGETNYKKAVILTSLAVACGAIMASAWAIKMTLLFTQGILASHVVINQLFALAVLGGSIGWILLSTKLGLPVSTTHAIVGSVVLTGIYAFGFDQVAWASATKKIVLPLLLSPIVAFGLTSLIFRFLFWLCRQQYCLNCHWAHWISALSSGFARGLNDTPKILALGLIFYFLVDPHIIVAPRWFFLILALSNALGGIMVGFRVTDTLAHKITSMNHLEGFAANLATSILVIAATIKGFPVSTTHVSSSAIMGMGLQKGFQKIQWKIVGEIIAAWLITLPTAGCLGIGLYWLLKQIV